MEKWVARVILQRKEEDKKVERNLIRRKIRLENKLSYPNWANICTSSKLLLKGIRIAGFNQMGL